MPSNSFKASQLIAHLKTLMEFHGDLDVVLPVDSAGRMFAITEKDVVCASSFNNQPLSGIVIAIAPRDPVADYTVQADGPLAGWNYDLSQAPQDGSVVKVYKRFGGEDTGYCTNGVWSVYEGGDKAWEVAPGGVLAWRA